MQYDQSKQGYGNQYPPMNQPQFGTGNVYPPNNAPPPYAQYPQQPAGYPAPGIVCQSQTMSQQQGMTAAPIYGIWNNYIATPITSGFRTFLVISGILYLIWGIVAIGLEIGIIVYSYSTYYRGFWAGGFLIGGGISMLIAACRVSYVMIYLIRMFTVALVFCIVALILSVVSITASVGCTTIYDWYDCDDTMAANLKIVILALFIVATVHTIINMAVTSSAQKRGTISTPVASVSVY